MKNIHAKSQNGVVRVHEGEELLGTIEMKENFKTAEIKIGEKFFDIVLQQKEIIVKKQGDIYRHIKSNLFSGNMEILETGKKITGAAGLKWGTMLMNNKQEVLMKIKNQNPFFNKNQYECEIVEKNAVEDLDILLTLWEHLYGSRMKQLLMLILGGVTGTIIFLIQ